MLDTGLRKSLPNLAASRSGEFSLPITDSNSEKGSCGDVSVGMTPSSSSQRVSCCFVIVLRGFSLYYIGLWYRWPVDCQVQN